MRSRTRTITYLILFVVGLAVGIRLGVLFVNRVDGEIPIDGLPRKATPTPDVHEQRRVLVVGVDRVGTTQARLQAIWYAAYIPQQPVVTFVPLYPPLGNGDSEKARLLEDVFALDPDGELHPNFLNTIEKEFGLQWQAAVLVDDFAMMALVDFMGGIGHAENRENGVKIIGSIPPAWEDAQQALLGQTDLLRALCDQISPKDRERDPELLFQLQPGHLRTQPGSMVQLQADWASMLLLDSDIRCNFPSFETPEP